VNTYHCGLHWRVEDSVGGEPSQGKPGLGLLMSVFGDGRALSCLVIQLLIVRVIVVFIVAVHTACARPCTRIRRFPHFGARDRDFFARGGLAPQKMPADDQNCCRSAVGCGKTADTGLTHPGQCNSSSEHGFFLAARHHLAFPLVVHQDTAVALVRSTEYWGRPGTHTNSKARMARNAIDVCVSWNASIWNWLNALVSGSLTHEPMS